MWRKTISHYCEPTTLPTVIAERCVHTKLTQASCQSCVDACPVNAWVMDDESLGIDTEVCDGCGLCASACPQGAVVSQKVMSALKPEGRDIALFACEITGIDGEQGIIPCLHAIGLQDLLKMYRSGTRHISVASGDCASCIRSKALRLWDLVEQLNDLLASRNLATISLKVLPCDRWKQRLEETRQEPVGPVLSRRNFFRMAAESSITIGMDIAGLQEEETFIPPGKQLPRTRPGDIVPFIPRINPAKCNGCDACARLCPQDAISMCTSDGNPQYSLDAESCTGCAICLDVCNQQAVSVVYWEPQVQFALHLTAQRCRACGAPFHSPVIQANKDSLCFVCTETNHARDLYQVMEQNH